MWKRKTSALQCRAPEEPVPAHLRSPCSFLHLAKEFRVALGVISAHEQFRELEGTFQLLKHLQTLWYLRHWGGILLSTEVCVEHLITLKSPFRALGQDKACKLPCRALGVAAGSGRSPRSDGGL